MQQGNSAALCCIRRWCLADNKHRALHAKHKLCFACRGCERASHAPLSRLVGVIATAGRQRIQLVKEQHAWPRRSRPGKQLPHLRPTGADKERSQQPLACHLLQGTHNKAAEAAAAAAVAAIAAVWRRPQQQRCLACAVFATVAGAVMVSRSHRALALAHVLVEQLGPLNADEVGAALVGTRLCIPSKGQVVMWSLCTAPTS